MYYSPVEHSLKAPVSASGLLTEYVGSTTYCWKTERIGLIGVMRTHSDVHWLLDPSEIETITELWPPGRLDVTH